MIDPLVTGLPASPDAERLVLGAMMLDGVQFPLIRHVIERHDFSEERHARIWDAIENLDGRGTPIDAYTVGEELQTGGKLESVGGFKLPGFTSRWSTSKHRARSARSDHSR